MRRKSEPAHYTWSRIMNQVMKSCCQETAMVALRLESAANGTRKLGTMKKFTFQTEQHKCR
jgi:hypothetical protein